MHIIQNNTYAPSNITVDLSNDLRIRAVIRPMDSESGLLSVDYTLKAADGPYSLTLIKNPLTDYNRAMEFCQKMTDERAAFMEVHGQQMEPPDCSWQHILGIWEVAHWYSVDDFADRMTVGMSVAAWNGINRTHKIFIQ